MKKWISKVLGWIGVSNRLAHLWAGFCVALFCGIVAALTAACAAEFKDWQYAGSKGGIKGIFKGHNGFDWLDVAATLIGGIFGEVIHYIFSHAL